MAGREGRDDRPAGRVGQQRRALAARRVEHGAHVGDLVVDAELAVVGQPRAAAVHEDQPREPGEAGEEPGQAGVLPDLLDVVDERADEQQVDRPVAVHLIGEVDVAVAGVARGHRHAPETTQRRKRRAPGRVCADAARDAPPRCGGLALVASATLAVLAGLAGDAPAKTPAQAITSINELRVAHGIPPLVNDPVLSTACQLHAHYMFLNGGWDQDDAHGEKPSNPGYTVRGAGAARRSVLAGTGWFAPNPWATAPVHLSQVLNPALRRTGYGQESVFICLDTVAGLTTQAADLLTYPGPNATGVPPALTAAEITPEGILTTPGVSVGLAPARGPGLHHPVPEGSARVGRRRHADRAGGTGARRRHRQFVIPRAPLPP